MDNIHAKYLTEFKVPVIAEGPTFKLFSDYALFVYNKLWMEFEFVEYVDDKLAEQWKLCAIPGKSLSEPHVTTPREPGQHPVAIPESQPDVARVRIDAIKRLAQRHPERRSFTPNEVAAEVACSA